MPNIPKEIMRNNLLNLADSYNPLYETQLNHWRAAIAKVNSGSANAKILCIGDSTTFGVGSNNTGGGTGGGNQKPLSFPTVLSTMLNAGGINAHWNSWMGDGSGTLGSNGINSINDSRIVLGSSWSRSSVSTSLGGYPLTASTSTNALAFTPITAVDTFDVYYIQASGNGVLSLAINAGTAVTQSTTGTTSIQKKTITGSLGTNTLNIKWSSGGSVYVIGVEAYDSSKKWVDVINCGWSGATSVDVSGNSLNSSPAPAITQLSPDLTLLCIGINDWVNSLSLSSFISSVQIVITAAKATGDCVVVTPSPSSNAMVNLSTQQTYIDALAGLCEQNDCLMIDNFSRWQSYEISNPLGLYYNSWHPNAVGYMDFATAISNILIESGITTPLSESTGTWTINDQSGAGLAFGNTAGNGYYIKIGHLCFAQFRLDYPITASGVPSYIGTLPFTCSTHTTNWIWGGFMSLLGIAGVSMIVDNGGTRFGFYDATGAQLTNAQLSGKQLRGVVIYETV